MTPPLHLYLNRIVYECIRYQFATYSVQVQFGDLLIYSGRYVTFLDIKRTKKRLSFIY